MLAKRDGKVAFLVVIFALFGLQGAFAQVSSSKLTKLIEGRLERYFDTVPVEVIVKDPGQVTLKGTVSTFEDEHLAYDITSRVKGVNSIAYDVRVKPARLVSDEEIKDQLTGYLETNNQIVAPGNIRVAVHKGVVTLTGSVINFNEFETAERVAAWQMGVTDVENSLNILARPGSQLTDSQISEMVRGVIEDRFPLVKNTVSANVANGNVTLTGRVETLWEKDNLPREIHRVTGVREVKGTLDLADHLEPPTAER